MNHASLATKKDAVLVKNNAKTIYDHLKGLTNSPTHHEKRWFWELLQNAKDSKINRETKVNINLTITGNELEFRHDGKPFTEDDILHIIFHGSTKDQLEGKTGKFGTGFMTTHLLSMKVKVKGILDDSRSFEFLLDREANNADELKIKLDESYDAFESCLSNSEAVDVFSSFTYILKEEKLEEVRERVEEIKKIAAYVLAFNNEDIGSIKILDNGLPWSIVLSNVNKDKSPILINEFVVSSGEEVKVLTYSDNDDFTIATALSTDGYITPLNRDLPRLFLDFPLFGAEEFGIPFLVNSSGFIPQKERTGIYINGNTPDCDTNRKLIEDSIVSVEELVKCCIEKGVKGATTLLEFNPSFKYDWNDVSFVNSVFSKTLEQLFNQPLFCTLNDEQCDSPKSLNECRFPVAFSPELSKELFALSSIVVAEELPSSEQYTELINYRENWKLIDPKFGMLNFNWTTKDILVQIDNESKIEYWVSQKFNGDEDSFFDWINRIVLLAKQENKLDLLSSYKCIPNQKGELTYLNKEKLFIDKVKLESGAEDIELKNLTTSIGFDIQLMLTHNKISNELNSLFSSYEHSTLHTEAVKILNSNKERYLTLENHLSNPLVKYWDWCFNINKIDFVKLVPIIMGVSDGESSKLDFHLLDTDTKVLLPTKWWPERLQSYAVLIPSKVVIHEMYNSVLDKDRINLLTTTYTHIWGTPIYEEEEQLKIEDVLNLVIEQDKTKLQSDSGQLEIQKVKLVKLYGFSMLDTPVLNRTRESKRKTRALIEFLLKDLIYADSSWEYSIPCKISATTEVRILMSHWVSKLKTNAWVYISASINENITAENLSTYIKELNLGNELKNPIVIRFLHALKLPVTDIIRNVYLDTSEKRQEYDSLYVDLIQTKKPASDIRGMLQDEELYVLYKQKQKDSDSVRQNQKVGRLFEQALMEIFESELFKEKGIVIKREPVGSDYILGVTGDIVKEEDLLSEKGEKVLITIKQGLKNPYYLELKATRGDRVSMTVTQASMSTQNINNYSLVVFKYDNEADITKENVLEKCLFVNNIGELLSPYYANQSKVMKEIDGQRTPKEIYIDAIYGDVRFRVSESVWGNGMKLRAFAEDFVSKREQESKV